MEQQIFVKILLVCSFRTSGLSPRKALPLLATFFMASVVQATTSHRPAGLN